MTIQCGLVRNVVVLEGVGNLETQLNVKGIVYVTGAASNKDFILCLATSSD